MKLKRFCEANTLKKKQKKGNRKKEKRERKNHVA